MIDPSCRPGVGRVDSLVNLFTPYLEVKRLDQEIFITMAKIMNFGNCGVGLFLSSSCASNRGLKRHGFLAWK